MSVSIVGALGNQMEVEANTKAARIVQRHNDYGSFGIYAKAMTSGIMAAGLAAGSPVFSFRYTSASNVALVKRVTLSAGDTATAFTAGVVTFNMFVARSFSSSDTGGTAGTLSGNNGKLRTSMATIAGVGDFRISSTATLSAVSRTLDTDPCGAITTSVDATAGRPLVAPGTMLFQALPGEYPLVCVQNEGFVIQATVPATGTWTFSVGVQWEEIVSYS